MNQWRKDIASWKCGDVLYLSVPFTWLLGKAEAMARAHRGKVVAGGPAIDLAQSDAPGTPEPIPWAETPGACDFDVLAMHNTCATFTTRGCPNKCPFCAVPKIEGEFRELDRWKAAPVICDNNLLAANMRHFCRVIASLKRFPGCDFNQGLDARRFTKQHAELIANNLRQPTIRFAFDHVADEPLVARALETARKAGIRTQVMVYVLIGFDDTPDDALYRLQTVVGWWKCTPCPMRYQPLDTIEKDAYVASGWTDYELRRMARYFWKYRFHYKTPYQDYRLAEEGLFAQTT